MDKNKKIVLVVVSLILGISATIGILMGIVLLNGENNEENVAVEEHEHTFVDATCDEPKTCSVCGETEGKALGHTVYYGKCERCETNQHEDQGMELSNIIMEIFDISTEANNIITSADMDSLYDLYSKCYEGSLKLKENNAKLTKVVELCGDYPETAGIKEACNNLLASDISISSSDADSVIGFLENFSSYLYDMADLMGEMSSFTELYV